MVDKKIKVWCVESLLEGHPGTAFCPRVGVSGSSRRQKLECLHGIVLWASAGRGLGREGGVQWTWCLAVYGLFSLYSYDACVANRLWGPSLLSLLMHYSLVRAVLLFIFITLHILSVYELWRSLSLEFRSWNSRELIFSSEHEVDKKILSIHRSLWAIILCYALRH